MKKSNLRKTMIAVAIMSIICLLCSISLATTPNVNDLLDDNLLNGIPELGDGNTNDAPQTGDGNTATTPDTNNENNNVANTNTNIANTNTNNTTLPKTGVDDTIMWGLLIISAVAAVYTYKKVRDYNV